MPRPPSPYGGERRRNASPPDYMDEFGGRHHEPGRERERRPRFDDDDRGGLRSLFSKIGALAYSNEDARPRRAKSYREPRPPRSDADSPPPRRRRDSPPPRAKARAPDPYDDYDDPNRPQRRQRPREDDYYSDSRHDRPRRDAYDERPRRRDAYDERPRRRDPYDDRYNDRYDDRYDDRPRRRDPYDDRYNDRPRRRDTYDDRPRRDRDRYDDRLLRSDPRDDRLRRGARNEPKWQKEAKDMFYTHALPVIKKEGSKFITKQLGSILAKQSGAGR